MGAPFAGRGGSVSGPQYRRFIFPKERAEEVSAGAGALSGQGWLGEGRRHRLSLASNPLSRRNLT